MSSSIENFRLKLLGGVKQVVLKNYEFECRAMSILWALFEYHDLRTDDIFQLSESSTSEKTADRDLDGRCQPISYWEKLIWVSN